MDTCKWVLLIGDEELPLARVSLEYRSDSLREGDTCRTLEVREYSDRMLPRSIGRRGDHDLRSNWGQRYASTPCR